MRRAATAEAAAVREWSHRLIDDPAANAIFRTGLDGMAGLAPEDRVRFVPLMFNFFKTFEQLHYQYLEGALDPDVWCGWEEVAKGYLREPGAKEYYRERRACFNSRFSEWVEALEPSSEFKHLGCLAESGSK